MEAQDNKNAATPEEAIKDFSHTIAEQDSAEDQQENEAAPAEDPIAKAASEVAEWKDKYLRLYSEYENFRRRTQREKADLILNAGQDVLAKMVPTLDDFQRAEKAVATSTDVEAIKDGISLVHHKLRSTLEQMGVKPMNAKGNPFNPDLHEAITQIPAPTPEQKGIVLDEVELGYMLNDKPLRFAKVVIGS
jgi:molecular chaperone GrpE